MFKYLFIICIIFTINLSLASTSSVNLSTDEDIVLAFSTYN